MIKFFSIFLFLLVTTSASASPAMQGPVTAEVIRVLDGDTFDVRAQIWVGHFIETRVRINGIDTPEMRSKCLDEKDKANAAKQALEKMVLQQTVYLIDIENGKYAGRVLAKAQTMDGTDLADAMIKNGYARPYNGGKRAGWCAS